MKYFDGHGRLSQSEESECMWTHNKDSIIDIRLNNKIKTMKEWTNQSDWHYKLYVGINIKFIVTRLIRHKWYLVSHTLILKCVRQTDC